MIFFWIFCIAVISLFVFFFFFGYFLFIRACGRRSHYPSDHSEHAGGSPIPEKGRILREESRRWFDTQAFEELSVEAFDGIPLFARFLPVPSEPKGLILCFHGYHSSCRRDLSIQAHALHKAGYHLLLVSQRAHGKSGGRYICFGAKEHRDALSWCEYMSRRFPSLPMALMGLSMGASTVLMSLSLGLPHNVKCVIADCGFTSPWEIIWRTLRYKHKIFPFPAIYFMNYWSRNLAHFDYRQISVLDILSEGSLPVLLFHGERDRFVPTEMSKKMAAIAPNRIELVIVSGAKHAQAVLFSPEEYISKLLLFLGEHAAD